MSIKNSYDYNGNYTSLARALRKNMTLEEKKLWYACLSLLPITAHRQKNVGNYIVDFYIPKNLVVVELDGSQHFGKAHKQADSVRDENLKSLGITVLRYSNSVINNDFGLVVKDILSHLDLLNEETRAFMQAKAKKRFDRKKNGK